MKKMNVLGLLVLGSAMVSMCVSCSNSGTSSCNYDPTSTFTGQEFTVTFYAGECVQWASGYTRVKVKDGLTVEAPYCARKDYQLNGWSLTPGGSPFDFSTPIRDNITLFALWQKKAAGSHTQEEIDSYMNGLKQNSADNHLYIHYYRFGNQVESYDDWDIWVWPNAPKAGEGVKFDWVGRTQDQTSKTFDASGHASIDEFGGAYVDIDLSKKDYRGGWDAETKTMGGTTVDYYTADGSKLDTKIGMQIVKSSTRATGESEFWVNDGSNQFIWLEDYALALQNGGTAYHVFVLQDKVSDLHTEPINELVDPFENDDGTKETYGNASYSNADWTDKAVSATSPSFLKGKDGDPDSPMDKGAGVGYQIMVASFADSDGDGFGDIYGIENKLDYLKDLGVDVLWLTPVQKSDSYHGYDTTDYSKVDTKFGSKVSPAAVANGGNVTEDTAMADYKSLIDKAHEKGMTVIMDMVLNHTSTGHNWFIQSAQLNDEYRGYYQWGNNKTRANIIKESNYWYPYGGHDYSFYAKFGSSMPELNYSYQGVRDAVIKTCNDWLDFGIDGFRMDAVKHIFLKDEVESSSKDAIITDVSASGDYSSNITKNLNFYKELAAAIKKDHPNAFMVGENFDGHAYHVAPYYEGFDSMFDFRDYFDLSSAAATGRSGTTSKYGTAAGLISNNGTYSASGDANLSGDKTLFNKVNGGSWSLEGTMKAYATYRSNPINGAFTSNHDIARCINRIAGTGNAQGIQAQGTVTTSNYESLEKSANCYKIATLLLPGLSWIYYGDEIGMTGNFEDGKTATDGYADLAYRQPMKWVHGASEGEDYTCGYYVTGSSMKVKWDEVNESASVQGAVEQAKSDTSTYAVMKKFANLKSSTPALIRGDFKGANNYASGTLAANVVQFSRTLNGETYKIAVNFNSSAITACNLGSTVVASYNGATTSNLPAYSAIVTK